ncbi:MAG: DMT family transporter [Pelagimonas sp.]|jgi:drug/metabolite transporter (DMT)-like permease|nr:DMT family transporter [Pelagimonas sp.]
MTAAPTDRPMLGIALMLGFCVLIPFGDALAKLLGDWLSVVQLVFLRFAFQAAILIPLALITGRSLRMGRRIARMVFYRSMLQILGIAAMFMALQHLPLADAVAIAFVMPFIMLLLGHFVLNEEVGMRRMIACAVGFVGTLMVVQPAFDQVGWPALLPLAVAVIFALFMLVTRQIAGQSDPVAIQAAGAPMALVVLIPLFALPLPAMDWKPIATDTWPLVIAMGCVGTVGHLLMTWSLRYAPAATLAPMQYLEIPMATLVGYLIFGDIPGTLASIGILVTIGSGLYIVMRERAMMARRATPAPERPDTSPAG